MFDLFEKLSSNILSVAAAALMLVSTSASAQAAGSNFGVNPRTEGYAATIGSEFAQYRNAIAARRSALSFGTAIASQDNNALTGTQPGGWQGLNSAWASLDAKQYNGTYSGDSTSFIFGADTLAGNTLIGLIGGYNTSTITLPSGQRVEAKGFSLGPYISAQLSDSLSLDGFIAYGKPDYDIDNGRFSGDKLFGNLTLTGTVPWQSLEFTPFISLASSREKLPAFSSAAPAPVVAYAPTTIKGLVATIGTGINLKPFERGNLLYLPRAGVEVDRVRSDDGFGNDTDFTTLRVSGGVTILGERGGWSFGADLAHTSEGTTTAGASASYFLQF